MKKLILLIVSLSACLSNAKHDQLLQQRIAQQDEEIALLKQSLTDREPAQPEASPTPAPMHTNVSVSRAVRVVRRQPEIYMGNVGTTNRDRSHEFGIDVTNHVCEPGKRNGNDCDLRRFANEFLSLEVEGRPVVFQSDVARPRRDGTTETFLRPWRTAHIMTGPDPITLTIRIYRNIDLNGDQRYPKFREEPYQTFEVRLDPSKGEPFTMNELRF